MAPNRGDVAGMRASSPTGTDRPPTAPRPKKVSFRRRGPRDRAIAIADVAIRA
jgi:hypothetical protein